MFWKKEKRTVEVDGKTVELQPKPSRIGMFKQSPSRAPSAQQPFGPSETKLAVEKAVSGKDFKKPTKMKLFIENIGAKHKGLEVALKQHNIKSSVYEFIKRMLIASIILGVAIGITMILLFNKIGMQILESVLFGALIGVMVFYMGFRNFLNFPTQKSKRNSKLIERDIIFAARDLIISLRSGMPLFNAITMVSTGYGEASKEFAKITQLVQLGTPLVEAIDRVILESKSRSFKSLMLQASVSIKSGADVVEALRGIIDELMQERNIELRRYGQKLNALAMFYMLFGIIFPSMGVAVITILTTFVSLFQVDIMVLEAVLVGVVFLQIVFLMMIKSSRPAFTM